MRDRADAGDRRDAQRETGEKDEEAGKAAAKIAQSEAKRERKLGEPLGAFGLHGICLSRECGEAESL